MPTHLLLAAAVSLPLLAVQPASTPPSHDPVDPAELVLPAAEPLDPAVRQALVDAARAFEPDVTGLVRTALAEGQAFDMLSELVHAAPHRLAGRRSKPRSAACSSPARAGLFGSSHAGRTLRDG